MRSFSLLCYDTYNHNDLHPQFAHSYFHNPPQKQLSLFYLHVVFSPSVQEFTGISKSSSTIFLTLPARFSSVILLRFASLFCFPQSCPLLPYILIYENVLETWFSG